MIGIVSSVFNPDMYAFGDDDYVNQPAMDEFSGTKEDKGVIGNFIDWVIGGASLVFNAIMMVFTFIWAGFTLDIPSVPNIIRIVMCSPIWGATILLVVSLIKGVGL